MIWFSKRYRTSWPPVVTGLTHPDLDVVAASDKMANRFDIAWRRTNGLWQYFGEAK
jgi:hypothetical protein